MTCTLKSNNLGDQIERTVFQIGIWDLVNIDNSNEAAVLSDTKTIAKDLISYFKSPIFDEMNIELPVAMDDYNEKFDHALSGWFFDVSFYQPWQIDICSIPTSGLPAYPNFNIVTIKDSLGNVIALLNGGQTYTVANQMVTIITTPYPNATGTTFACTNPAKIIGVFVNQSFQPQNNYTISGNNVVLNTAASNDYITIVEVQ